MPEEPRLLQLGASAKFGVGATMGVVAPGVGSGAKYQRFGNSRGFGFHGAAGLLKGGEWGVAPGEAFWRRYGSLMGWSCRGFLETLMET